MYRLYLSLKVKNKDPGFACTVASGEQFTGSITLGTTVSFDKYIEQMFIYVAAKAQLLLCVQ